MWKLERQKLFGVEIDLEKPIELRIKNRRNDSEVRLVRARHSKDVAVEYVDVQLFRHPHSPNRRILPHRGNMFAIVVANWVTGVSNAHMVPRPGRVSLEVAVIR